jgi:hypothetical protein
MYIGLHVKYLLFLSDFNETWIFSTVFSKILKYHISWKSIQWELSCSKQTDMMKLIIEFHNFANTPKNNHIGHCTHTLESTKIQVQNVFNMQNITYNTSCKYKTPATLYTLETWFVSGI